MFRMCASELLPKTLWQAHAFLVQSIPILRIA
jgi:hypothetical protein